MKKYRLELASEDGTFRLSRYVSEWTARWVTDWVIQNTEGDRKDFGEIVPPRRRKKSARSLKDDY
jgi:hypothetical protein